MIAKGLDFPNVTLVGVVNADVALHVPDFRSAERTFQLLSQVAGRAGRGPSGGRVMVQTFNPEHPCIAHVNLECWFAEVCDSVFQTAFRGCRSDTRRYPAGQSDRMTSTPPKSRHDDAIGSVAGGTNDFNGKPIDKRHVSREHEHHRGPLGMNQASLNGGEHPTRGIRICHDRNAGITHE